MAGNPAVDRATATSDDAMLAETVVGIDLGGTKILAGIADLEGKVLATLREPTEHGPGAPVLDQMASLVGKLANQAGIDASSVRRVVIGVPSAVSPTTGLASLSPNLALPEDQPLAQLMEARLHVPVHVENDVNLAAFGEAVVGAGKGLSSVAFLSFGTGVGLGLVVDGKMLRGAFGRAGEIAYLPTGSDVHQHAPVSENGLFEDEVGTRGDPDLTVIGGGIGSQPYFFERIRHHLAPLLPFDCRLEPSRHGAEAGMLGAVLSALDTQIASRD